MADLSDSKRMEYKRRIEADVEDAHQCALALNDEMLVYLTQMTLAQLRTLTKRK